jgi:hypothetical protein
MLSDLTPGQRDRIRQLLEAELRDACRAALRRGTPPADLADLVAGRRRALEDLLRTLAARPGPDAGPRR